MQTYWDSIQQIIRIVLYAAAGALVSRGVLEESLVEGLVGGAVGIANGIWTIIWNRNSLATVEGMKQGGLSNASREVAEAKGL